METVDSKSYEHQDFSTSKEPPRTIGRATAKGLETEIAMEVFIVEEAAMIVFLDIVAKDCFVKMKLTIRNENFATGLEDTVAYLSVRDDGADGSCRRAITVGFMISGFQQTAPFEADFEVLQTIVDERGNFSEDGSVKMCVGEDVR